MCVNLIWVLLLLAVVWGAGGTILARLKERRNFSGKTAAPTQGAARNAAYKVQ